MMDSGALIQVQSLGVSYGKKRILTDVSFSVKPGQVYALLGRNGSGKSSLVRCILGWQQPNEGRVELFGHPAWSSRGRAMERVGVMQESPDVPGGMRVDQAVAFCGRFYPTWDSDGIAARIKRAGISFQAPAGSLSRGQKAQLALALALGPRPELLVLDDPTLGLDAVARRAFFESLVTELADRGVSVLLTTHDLAGVEGVADRVGILNQGRLILDEPMEHLKARVRRLRWDSRHHPEPDLKGLDVLRMTRHPWGAEALVMGFDEASQHRFESSEMDIEPMALEDLFIALVDENEEVRA